MKRRKNETAVLFSTLKYFLNIMLSIMLTLNKTIRPKISLILIKVLIFHMSLSLVYHRLSNGPCIIV